MIQMNNQQIHLFVQEGCRPCQYVKTQLAKVEGWESLITITDSKCCDEWTNFAKESGVIATPTLVAFEGGAGRRERRTAGGGLEHFDHGVVVAVEEVGDKQEAYFHHVLDGTL